MKQAKRSVLLILGIALILLSLSLLAFFQIRSHTAARNLHKIVAEMKRILPETTPGMPNSQSDPAMPVLQIQGADYVAMIDIPTFGITLPVADQWDSNAIYAEPHRYFGSVYDHTMVIGGWDEENQFAFCSQIQHGTKISVMDMTGAVFTYTVARVDRSTHAEAAWLTDSDWDLTLFCRDTYSLEYIAVRCQFSFGENIDP